MARRLFLLLIASFISIVNAPTILTATDTVTVIGLSNDGVVETIPLLEPELESEPELEPTHFDAFRINLPDNHEATIAMAPVTNAIPANNIQINGRTIELGFTASTAEDAGNATRAWYYSNGTFIYGHNSANVFGFLNAAHDGGWLNGMSFSVTMNGETQSFTVANYRLYDYDAGDPRHLRYGESTITMNPIVNAKMDSNDLGYRMAIMTCYAGSSKRLVVFAN